MRRYDDPFIHFVVAILLVVGFFAIFSGFTLPRVVYYSVYHPNELKPILLAFKPLVFLLAILSLGGIVYLLLSKGFTVKRIFGKRVKERTVVYGVTAVALFLTTVVVLEKPIFGLPVNRWLIGPKHMVLITGLVVTAYFLFLSYQLSRERIDWLKTLAVVGLFVALLVLQPDFGTTSLAVGSFLLLWFISSTNRFVKYFFASIFLLVLAVIVFSILNARLNVQLPSLTGGFGAHIVVRINNWLNPFHDVTDRSYQIANALYAVHKGGVDGVGYGATVLELANSTWGQPFTPILYLQQ